MVVEDPIPTHAQVAVASVRDTTWIAWAVGPKVLMKTLDEDGLLSEEATELFDSGDEDIAGVAALSVGTTAWFGFATADGQVHVQQARAAGLAAIPVPLFGPPTVAAVGRSMLIFGRHESGRLGWTFIGDDDGADDIADPFVDDANLPTPDSATTITGGIVVRFSDSGQCLFLDSAGPAQGTFPCKASPGRLIGDGVRAYLAHAYDAVGRPNDEIGVSQVFGALGVDPFPVMGLEVRDFLRFGKHNGEWPAIGRTIRGDLEVGDSRIGAQSLAIMGPEELWESAQGFPNWPYPNARAISRRDGVAYVFDFPTAEPVVQTVELEQRAFANEPYAIVNDPECVADYEVCNGRDNDCDDRRDNGLCCPDDFGVDLSFTLDEGQDVHEIEVTDTERGDAYRIAMRIGDGLWRGFTATLKCPNIDSPGCPAGRRTLEWPGALTVLPRMEAFEGPTEGWAFVANGGFNALVGPDDSGEGKVWWHYHLDPSVNLEICDGIDNDNDQVIDENLLDCINGACVADHGCPPFFDLKVGAVPLPEGCSSILADASGRHHAIEYADHTLEDASLLALCPEGIARFYPSRVVDDVFYPYPEGVVGKWATITRPPSGQDVFRLLIAYESDLGATRFQPYLFTSNAPNDPRTELATPTALVNLTDEEAAEPIWLHPITTRASVQMTSDNRARVRLRGFDREFGWHDVVTVVEPDRIEYAVGVSQLFVSKSDEDGTGFWVVDVEGVNGYNLWSTAPAVVHEGPLNDWQVTNGEYRDALTLVFPDGEEANRFHLRTRHVRCNDL